MASTSATSIVSSARASAASVMEQVETYLASSAKPKPLRLLYQTTPSWPFPATVAAAAAAAGSSQGRQVDVGVLDSSFNPPQLAHYALARSAKPALRDEQEAGGTDQAPKDGGEKSRYDALLLLFSVRNADKGTGTSKDASTAQRLGMMECLAHDLERDSGANVAVGIIEEPLMIAKSTLIHEYVKGQRRPQKQQQGQQQQPVRLHWLVGFDTLERFFQVKYYPSPGFFAQACRKFFEEERTTFICARRGLESQPNKQHQQQQSQQQEQQEQQGQRARQEEQALVQGEEARPWTERGSIVMMDLDPSVQCTSSTAIRKLIAERGLEGDEINNRLQHMTTPSVARYLMDEGIYRASESANAQV